MSNQRAALTARQHQHLQPRNPQNVSNTVLQSTFETKNQFKTKKVIEKVK